MRAWVDDPVRELAADFDLNFHDDNVGITVHSRGGSASSGNQRNPDYEPLVQALLERLRSAGAVLEEVLLASKTVASLPRSERRIDIEGYDYPVDMAAIRDVTDLRLAIRRAVVRSHSKSSNALHGNATKKIELVASCPDPPQDMLALLKDGFLEPVEDKGVMDSATFLEGRRVLQIHYRRERNQSLVRTAKSQFKERNGHLFCEVCDFDFSKAYGELGSDFIEAHHEDFLANRKNESETRITDLRMVCANCHRMLHRTGLNGQLVTIEQLRGMVI